MNFKINWDALGIATSVACAIHCAILPLLLTSLPVFGFNIIENVAFEFVMIAIAFLIGIRALWHGYKRHHHSSLPVILFTTGIVFLLGKQVFYQWHIILLVVAVSFIVAAHFYNYRLCQKAKHCHATDCNH
jgi:MerC mercury resistance protein